MTQTQFNLTATAKYSTKQLREALKDKERLKQQGWNTDQLEGEVLKAEGMALAGSGPDWAWKHYFRICGEDLARKGDSFTAEDVLQLAGPPPGSPNVVGPAMNSLARELKLTKVGYRPAKRPSRHAAIVAIWQMKTNL